mmetsp:Transcript_5455/g.15628  ORF Transcript_5455/g.15628 Transcript_5455/m.15628 type:complete len:904 (-) Transcript_5455:259-2970(-)|eukprot:CAMPEP_0194545940 /NCGR_PEP_ID=MMETSP0253-20130528/89918_1 /TAXON_ID=2966 /ORGANISM="Noctiluca scintillans" /LENGTH=903 /DNA_ID=CAMNT_0039392987 /DNA_START=32 /DNA_END=2743 /DNA_ORIENTATION=-
MLYTIVTALWLGGYALPASIFCDTDDAPVAFVQVQGSKLSGLRPSLLQASNGTQTEANRHLGSPGLTLTKISFTSSSLEGSTAVMALECFLVVAIFTFVRHWNHTSDKPAMRAEQALLCALKSARLGPVVCVIYASMLALESSFGELDSAIGILGVIVCVLFGLDLCLSFLASYFQPVEYDEPQWRFVAFSVAWLTSLERLFLYMAIGSLMVFFFQMVLVTNDQFTTLTLVLIFVCMCTWLASLTADHKQNPMFSEIAESCLARAIIIPMICLLFLAADLETEPGTTVVEILSIYKAIVCVICVDVFVAFVVSCVAVYQRHACGFSQHYRLIPVVQWSLRAGIMACVVVAAAEWAQDLHGWNDFAIVTVLGVAYFSVLFVLWSASTATWLRHFPLPLILGIISAMVWANLQYESYHKVVYSTLIAMKICTNDVTFYWLVNDVYMTFVFGLAMKQITKAARPGGLIHPLHKAVNTMLAACGGIVGPISVYCTLAAIFTALELIPGSVDIYSGFGIPTASDLSFAWILAPYLFGTDCAAAKFLLLLATADDVFGLFVIGIFYTTGSVHFIYLLCLPAGMLAALVLRLLDVRWWSLYVFGCGSVVWYGLSVANLQPAVALALIVPFMPGTGRATSGETDEGPEDDVPQVDVLLKYERDTAAVMDVGLFFFGFANAGVEVSSAGWTTVLVYLSITLGKVGGISGASFLASACGANRPPGTSAIDLLSIATLGGVGLTEGLFMASESFSSESVRKQAKLGVMCSLCNIGFSFLIKRGVPRIFPDLVDRDASEASSQESQGVASVRGDEEQEQAPEQEDAETMFHGLAHFMEFCPMVAAVCLMQYLLEDDNLWICDATLVAYGCVMVSRALVFSQGDARDHPVSNAILYLSIIFLGLCLVGVGVSLLFF